MVKVEVNSGCPIHFEKVSKPGLALWLPLVFLPDAYIDGSSSVNRINDSLVVPSN